MPYSKQLWQIMQTLLSVGELEVRQIVSELDIAGSFLELTIRFAGVKLEGGRRG